MKTINTNDYDQFQVTGVTRDNKRFKKTYKAQDGKWAFGINLWMGSVWGVKDNKRTLLKRVFN